MDGISGNLKPKQKGNSPPPPAKNKHFHWTVAGAERVIVKKMVASQLKGSSPTH
jgi:hypothetical protein